MSPQSFWKWICLVFNSKTQQKQKKPIGEFFKAFTILKNGRTQSQILHLLIRHLRWHLPRWGRLCLSDHWGESPTFFTILHSFAFILCIDEKRYNFSLICKLTSFPQKILISRLKSGWIHLELRRKVFKKNLWIISGKLTGRFRVSFPPKLKNKNRRKNGLPSGFLRLFHNFNATYYCYY